jgi:hypothetical protein
MALIPVFTETAMTTNTQQSSKDPETQRLLKAMGWDERPPENTSRSLLARDFPTALTAVVGRERLEAAPTVKVRECGTGYFDGCFHLGMMPVGGIVKAFDQHGRTAFTFTVRNPQWRTLEELDSTRRIEERVLFTVFQRYSNDRYQQPDELK